MGVEWQSRDFLTDWTGLYNRRQSIDVPPSYSRTARNVDFYGSAMAKRQGTQIVTGWGTLATGPGPWTMPAPLQARGQVTDASGFQVGDLCAFGTASGLTGTGVVSAISGNTMTFTSFTAPLPTPGVTAIFTRRDLGARCQGLYHAVFRDGTEQLLAAAGGYLWNVWATKINGGVSYAPAVLTTHFPTTTIGSTWGSLNSGPLTSFDTLVATNQSSAYQPAANSVAFSPDIIQIIHAGTIIYEGTIASFSGSNANLTGNCSQLPQGGDTVVMFPHGSAADTRFTMLNNRVYVTSMAAQYTPQSGPGAQAFQRQPPVVIEQPPAGGAPYVRRMGVRAPTFIMGLLPIAGSGALVSGSSYSYRFTYVNGNNGQESEASPEAVVTMIPGTNTVQYTVKKSPDPQVTGINVYRSLANQTGTWYLVTPSPLPNNSATYTDGIAESSLGQLLKTFANECPPDTVCLLAVWTQAGALIGLDCGPFTAGGEQVVWSDAPDIVNGVYKLESWPINNTLFVNRDDGDHLVSLGVFFDSVVVWKGRSMHRIVGAPPDIILQPISFRDDHTGVGIWSAKGFIMDTDVAVFVSDDGFYQVSRYEGIQQGFTSSRISRQIDQEFYFRTGFGNSTIRANRELSHLLYHRVKRRLQAFIPVDGNAGQTDIFVYQMEGTVEGTPHGWSLWSVPVDFRAGTGVNPPPPANYISASCMVNSMTGVDVPHYALGAFGLILKADTGAGDFQGYPVTIMSDTVWFSGGGAGSVCRARAVDFVFVPQAGIPAPLLRFGTDFNAPDRYQLPQLGALGVPANVNPLILELGQYMSVGIEETSITGLFLVEDFTLWFQRLPVGVTPRLIPVQV